jgi:hypothetical protein
MRRHLTYANVAATLALLFAMSGGALAAKHYLINSSKQINPKVLKTLRGKTGPRGPAGAAGATGPQGSPGAEGKPAQVAVPLSATAASVAFAPGKAAEVASSLKLSPGTYSLLAATLAENTSAASDEVECVYLDNAQVFGEVRETVSTKSSVYLALPGTLLTVTPANEELDLACKSNNTAEGAFKAVKLFATKIG